LIQLSHIKAQRADTIGSAIEHLSQGVQAQHGEFIARLLASNELSLLNSRTDQPHHAESDRIDMCA